MRRLAPLLALLLFVAPAFAQSTQSIPFRRISDPVQLTVAATPTMTMVPQDRLKDPKSGQRVTSFYVVNPNSVYVRFKGFSTADDCANQAVTPTTGWLVPPGFVGVFSTQYPMCGSTLAVSMPGNPITSATTYAPLEWSYGFGQ
jgi:hypothetical protein